jgi:hypothetical protein
MDVRNGLTIRSQDAAWPRRAFLLCSIRRGWLRETRSNKGERRRESPTAAPVTGVRGRLFSAKIDDEEDRRIKVPTASFRPLPTDTAEWCRAGAEGDLKKSTTSVWALVVDLVAATLALPAW